MNKTQESVLKQCISLSLLTVSCLGISAKAMAYSSVAPLEMEAGPSQGLIFEPRLGVQSENQTGGTSDTELNLNLAWALSPDFSIYGRYSIQNDQRLGMNYSFFKKDGLGLNSVFETSLAPDSSLRFTAGLNGTLPIRLKGLPSLAFQAGGAFSYDQTNESASIPVSLNLQHPVEGSGIFYGIGMAGEESPSDNQNWFSFTANAGYQNRAGLEYKLMASVPMSSSSQDSSPALNETHSAFAANNATTIGFALVIPFGGQESAPPAPKSFSSPYAESVPGRYDLDAKIISMNEALFLLKIDKGSSDSVAKGQSFDIYSEDKFLARAEVISVKKDEAALNVVEYKQEHWIELGFSARRLGE